MKTRIAVATVNGRAYYEFVNELQRKGLPFLSLKPWDPIPMNIQVVLTTEKESNQISHSNILLFEQGSKPKFVVDKANLIIQGKKSYERIVIGVDPGKTYGMALLGDNKVLETLTASNIEEVTLLILDSLKRFPAEVRLVRVGDGLPEHTETLLIALDKTLPADTFIEIVSEAKTSQLVNKSVNRRVLRDAVSAIKIAERNGRVFSRRDIS
ncbi:hypothetical protein ACFLRN_04415 [Thermoproteota archaeon]